MILIDKDIRKLCEQSSEEKKILISPFDESSLQSESYDLSVGTKVAVMKKEIKCLSMENQEEIDSIYEEVKLSSDGYVLSPKEYILVSIKERITLPENITAHVRPRTRFTRLGLIISDQHCNSTYSGNFQLGVFNATDYAIKILPGVKLAQIVFEQLNDIPTEEKQYKNKVNAIYQNEHDFIGAKVSDEMRKKVDSAIDILLKREE